MRDSNDDGWEDWTYWSEVANEVLTEQKKRDDWVAWLRFRAKLLGPFDQ
jgi:hypothetical protein